MSRTKKLTYAGVLCGVAIVGSALSFPIFGSRCAPVQHIVNVIAAVLFGPFYAIGMAFVSSLIRNMLSMGTILAFPGSMFGAFLAGVMFKIFKKPSMAALGEIFGTSVLGGLAAYPLAIKFLGSVAGTIFFYSYILPFFVSTSVGAILGLCIIKIWKKGGYKIA
ncbi:MAG: energy coupling factor transporter S component ThiW [Tissierellia bacterium]|nr:energy coupling factor transporter S component ThiW [Tissierellia bacterium]